MLRFKAYLMEKTANVSYGPMRRDEWTKYGDERDRIALLVAAIKAGDPVSDKQGNDLYIANTQKNINAALEFWKSDATTFELTLKDGTVIKSNTIGKSQYFGGQGKGKGATGATAQGESLQCVFLAAMLGEGSDKKFSHYTPKLLGKYYDKVFVDISLDTIMQAEPQWFNSAYVTAKYLIDNKIVDSTHEFHRGSTKMNDIYKAKTAALKAQGMPGVQNDKWNPGDIWAIKKSFTPSRSLNKTDIFALNEQIKDLYNNGTMIGISLKQIKDLKTRAQKTVYNMEATELGKHTFTAAQLVKRKRGRTDFWSAKSGTMVWDRDQEADLRAGTNLGAVNFEGLGKGARAGRAGWEQIQYALKTHLGVTLGTSVSYRADATAILKGTNKSLITDFYNKAKKVESDLTREEFDEYTKNKKVDQGFVHAKYLATLVAHAFVNSTSKAKKDAAISYLVNHSRSKINVSSVFIKISA